MPIINLTTDLKSLHYGMDRPGGESSGQPFLFTGFKNININAPTINNPNGIGQNFLDIPALDLSPLLNVPASIINSVPGASGTFSNSSFTIFKGNGVDVASPIIDTINTVVNGVTSVINTGANAVIDTFDPTRNSNYPDFLLRKNRFNIAHSFADVVRVSKFFTTPAGIFFILKQNILERQNPKLVNRDRLYNPLNTVVQVGINSYGNHLNKSDIDPFQDSYYTGGTYGYFYSTRGLGEYPIFQELSTGDIENRLTIAYKAKIANQDLGELTINPFGISYNPDNNTTLLSYPGGPGSVLGIGDTVIRIQNPTRPVNPVSEEGKFQPSFYLNNADPTDELYLTPFNITSNWTFDPLNSIGVSQKAYTDINWKSEDNQITAGQRLLPYDSFTLNRKTNYVNRNEPKKVDYNKYINRGFSISYFNDDITDAGKYLVPTIKLYAGDTSIGTRFYSDDINWALQKVDKYSLASYEYYYNTIESPAFDAPPSIKNEISESFGFEGDFKNLPGSYNVLQSVFEDNTTGKNHQYVFNYSQTISEPSLAKYKTTGLPSIADFRKTIVDDSNGQIVSLPNTNYSQFNRESTYKTSTTNYRGNYNGTAYVLDPNIGISSDNHSNSSDDLIPFYFQTYAGTGASNTVLFRAYLEDWSDNFKADWGGIKYMGRAESLYKYEGFSRDGSVTFNVPVLSASDLKNTYSKLNGLVNSVAPFYSTGTVSGLLTGVITRITMGDYWKSMPILMKDVGFTPINDMGWDIGRDVNGNRKPGFQLPKGIKVNVSFIIIHSETPEYGIDFVA